MKILLALLLLPVLALAEPAGVVYNTIITRVIDGDTVAFRASFLPAPLKKELSLRIYGVDTPEKGSRAKCPAEDKAGQQATEFTKTVVAQSTNRQILLMGWDKYGGRVLGDLILDNKSLRSMLIEQGYAREYHGEAKKSWCN